MVADLKMAYSKKSLEKIEIRPCPFCGSIDNLEITSDNQFYELYGKHGGATITIKCTKCYAEMYEHDYNGNNYDQKAKLLIEKWNRRNGE